ncbi:MAG: nucleoside triphosphate pyrophosphohydrolase [Chlorobiota bacterium]
MPHPIPQPAQPNDPVEQFRALWEIVRLLRRECPWDREQTHASIAPLLIEEAYETVEAIRAQDWQELARELGDLLLHVLMHSAIAEESNEFHLSAVIAQESQKLIHRHPHVFAHASAENAQQVKQRWEQLKLGEGRRSLLEGIPKSLPALLRAQRLQERAASVGFDWNTKEEVWQKVAEEFAELRTALQSGDPDRIASELGDVLFALVNAARFERLNAEECLQSANDRFTRRFQYIEQAASAQNRPLEALSLAEMDELWNQAKQQEAQE